MDRQSWKSLHIFETTDMQQVSPALQGEYHYLLLKRWKTMNTLFSTPAQTRHLGSIFASTEKMALVIKEAKNANRALLLSKQVPLKIYLFLIEQHRKQ